MFDDPRLPDRFWVKAQPEPNTGCWLWIGACNKDGYGQFQHRGAQIGAHVAAYRELVGQIPEGLQLDHLCRNRACVNPAHLEAVTPSVNSARRPNNGAVNRAKTRCPRGHEYTTENTYILPSGSRRCRTCEKQLKRERKARVA